MKAANHIFGKGKSNRRLWLLFIVGAVAALLISGVQFAKLYSFFSDYISGNIGIQLNVTNDFVKIESGDHHTLALTRDGRVYAWGNNAYGQLGMGNVISASVPTLIPGLKDVIDISTGWNMSYALTRDGKVYAWGLGASYALGNGSTLNKNIPTLVTMPAGVRFTKISADGWVAMALAENGDAYAWGYNVEGQCGDGKDIDVPVPTKIKDLPIIKEIAMGSHAAAAIDENGVLYTWGADDGIFGELGDELENKDPDPRKENLPKTYSGLKDVKYIYADTYGMIAIKNNGDVYTWGTNDGFGRAGNGKTGASNDQRTPYLQTMIKNGKQAVGYFDYTLVVTEDGKLYACGHNNVQKLGFGDAVDRAIMTLVPGLTNVKWASALYDATSVLLGDDVHTAGYNASYEFGNNSIKSTGRGQTHLHGKWLRPSL